jgi:hypothetical protein
MHLNGALTFLRDLVCTAAVNKRATRKNDGRQEDMGPNNNASKLGQCIRMAGILQSVGTATSELKDWYRVNLMKLLSCRTFCLTLDAIILSEYNVI